jgi:hypothetical protein
VYAYEGLVTLVLLLLVAKEVSGTKLNDSSKRAIPYITSAGTLFGQNYMTVISVIIQSITR